MKNHYFDNRIFYKKNDFIPGRPAIIFVHGLSGSSSAWVKYENFFKQKYNVLSFDLRGHGQSHKPKEYDEYQIEKFSEDLFDLIKYEKINNFVLVGHSFGSLIVLDFLSRYQASVRAAVLLSPNYKIGTRQVEKILKLLLPISKILEIVPFSGRPRGQIDYSRFPNTGDWNIRRMIADIHKTSWRVYLFSTRQSYKFDKEDFLEKINIPALIIHGKKDTIFPCQNSILMDQKIKKSKLVLLDDTDHIIVLNNFDEIAKAINNFIDEL